MSGGGQQGPPDKLIAYDLSMYSTSGARANGISNYIEDFKQHFGLYPSIVLLDSLVNTVYLGAYGSNGPRR